MKRHSLFSKMSDIFYVSKIIIKFWNFYDYKNKYKNSFIENTNIFLNRKTNENIYWRQNSIVFSDSRERWSSFFTVGITPTGQDLKTLPTRGWLNCIFVSGTLIIGIKFDETGHIVFIFWRVTNIGSIIGVPVLVAGKVCLTILGAEEVVKVAWRGGAKVETETTFG